MKILIIGGGIAGVTLAYLLQQNHDVTVIEKGPTWRTIGYGVGIWKNGLDVLQKLPLDQKFWDSGCIVHEGAMLSPQGEPLFRLSFDALSNGETIAMTFERETIHGAIHDLLRDVEVRFNTSIQAVAQSSRDAEVEFDDGSKERFDLIVGADGLRSLTRTLIFGSDKLKSYGWNILGAWAPAKTQLFSGYHTLSEIDESLLSIPYHDKHAIGFIYRAKTKEWPQPPASKEALLARFPRLRERFREMLSEMQDPSTMFCDVLQYVEMDEWFKGRVVLVGDARHGMSPYTGMGTSLALEDAFVLAEELNTNTSVDSALNEFAKRRNKRLRSIKTFRALFEISSLLGSPSWKTIRDIVLRIVPKTYPNSILKEIFDTRI